MSPFREERAWEGLAVVRRETPGRRHRPVPQSPRNPLRLIGLSSRTARSPECLETGEGKDGDRGSLIGPSSVYRTDSMVRKDK